MAEFDGNAYLVKALDIDYDTPVLGYYKAFYKHYVFDVFAAVPRDVEINPYTLCRNTGIKAEDCYLYENDIVSYLAPLSDKIQYGFIDFDDHYKCYIVRTGIECRATRLLRDCVKIKSTGRNIALSDEDFKWFSQWEKEQWEETKSKVIDNSYCPSKFRR